MARRRRSGAQSPASAPAPGIVGSSNTRELLRRLELDVTHRLDGMLHGDYRGLVPGHGSEPGETRRYEPGDDIRRIDWNVTARMQTPHVRQTIADRELQTRVLVDTSPSLDFGTALCEKRELALGATAAVGFLTARVGNRLGAVLCTPSGVVTIPARQGRHHLLAILHRLAAQPRLEHGRASLAEGLAHLAHPAQRRGLCVVISDFLDDGDWARELRRVTLRNDTLCIEVLDPREVELPDVGVLTLIDAETGERREVHTGSRALRTRYAEAAAAQRDRTRSIIGRSGADHLVLRTDRDWLRDLASFVAVRKNRTDRAGGGRA